MKIRARYRRVRGRCLCSISWLLWWRLRSEVMINNYAWGWFDWLENCSWLDQVLDWFLSCDDHLKHSDDRTSQSVFVVIFWINFFQRLKGLQRIVKVAHLITIITDKLQDIVRVWSCFCRQVNVPCVFGLSIHEVGSDQPLDVALFCFVFLVSDQ